MKILILSLLILTGCATSGVRWTATDQALEGASVAAVLADAMQTDDITRDCREGNPIMGPCGERVPPTLFFAATVAASIILPRILPQPWRRAAHVLRLGLHTEAVIGNWSAGYAVVP